MSFPKKLFLSLIAIFSSAMAFDCEASNPSVGDRIIEAAASRELLWVLNSDGDLFEFDRANGSSKLLAENSVIDIERQDGRLLALIRSDGSEAMYQVFDFTNQKPVSTLLELSAPPIAFTAREQLAVLGVTFIHILEGNEWKHKRLSAKLREAPQVSTGVAKGVIYVGYNIGEFGGGMQAINPSTGRVSEIRRIDGEVCEGPLGVECNPVTGIVGDLTQPECLLAAIGLIHFIADGRILRICGDKVEIVFSEKIPPPDDDKGNWPDMTWPFFGIAPSREGWFAISDDRLFQSSKGIVTQVVIPPFEEWNGLQLSAFSPELLILRTDVNWGVSLSGYTPLLVQITE